MFGNVYEDAGKTVGVNGVKVSGGTSSFMTRFFSQDPAAKPGFFSLFAPAGTTQINASKAGASKSQAVTLLANGVVSQDIILGWWLYFPSLNRN